VGVKVAEALVRKTVTELLGLKRHVAEFEFFAAKEVDGLHVVVGSVRWRKGPFGKGDEGIFFVIMDGRGRLVRYLFHEVKGGV